MAIITVNNATATSTAKEVMPNTNIDAPRSLASSAFKKLHTNILAIVDNATQIAAITKRLRLAGYRSYVTEICKRRI